MTVYSRTNEHRHKKTHIHTHKDTLKNIPDMTIFSFLSYFLKFYETL